MLQFIQIKHFLSKVLLNDTLDIIYKPVWYNGIIFAFQAKDVGSIPTTGSNLNGNVMDSLWHFNYT